MATTTITMVQDLVAKYWAPIFTKELREKLLLGSLVNRDFEGQIKKGGDTVYVTQIAAAEGQLRTVGVDAAVFDTETLSAQRLAIKADKRAVAAFEFEDLIDIQTQLNSDSSEIRDALLYGVMNQVNTHLYSQVAAHASHTITGVTNFDATQLANVRKLAAQARWGREKGWVGLLDPSYYSDLLNSTMMSSVDYTNDKPIVGGVIGEKRMGFTLVEDDSRPADRAIFFHPDFLHLVMQTQPTFKVSDLHAQKKFGYVISVDMIFGSGAGIGGDKKVITVTGAA